MAVAEHHEEAQSAEATGRERLPYRLNTTLDFLSENAQEADTKLEALFITFDEALDNDGVIDGSEAAGIRAQLSDIFIDNVRDVGVLNLLQKSGTEAAVREVERVQRLKKQKKKRGK